ncbi:protein-L-isoaspartate(D-aspartate) O-methyltransferase [Salarchaeum sp. JOR-1]|uniref:protein-L-isoaspartate(D-aspartate) O-methyltransferase n=1 Tax=Salarchaeum sp. JOR-1 TaxID=2599399 RepID=UPI001198CA77|nr:protein-L-isoaspartate(D-aspartate) O-methyltransferase [Salarchaeum sp. JOR-1]QDX39966.1 protein-L-isoaspartate(D-aspartate) O-methyltransferase [Salarchaeum sp. JOR-1]
MNDAAARDNLADRLARRHDFSERVLDAIREVPRHEFVPDAQREDAYADRPLPIGDGQTVSAPHMVAAMCDRLTLRDGEQTLEIGTGCGYHAAVTAELVGPENVYSVEYLKSLAETARENLDRTGYGAISVRQGDGHDGWSDHAPYDAAYLTCATPSLPAAVIDQLRDGGRVLAPVGDVSQTLVYGEKHDDTLDREFLTGVRFVRMQGGE